MTHPTHPAAALEPIETASRDELQALQLERLKWSLRHAYDNVAHYRRTFDAAGVHPDDLHTLADLAKFPFTTKNDLRDNYPFGLFAVPREQVVRVHASSGTTGKPTVVGYTARDIDTWANVTARSIRAAGGRPGDTLHNAFGYGLFTGGLGIHYGAERLGCMVVPMSGGQTEKQVQLIRDFEPKIILVTPSYMLNLIDEMVRQGMDPADSSLKIGIFGAEPWTQALRDEVETRAGIDALDIYGLSEVMGPGVACECVETKDGPVIWEDHFYPEIIDPATGEVLPDGSAGELVFTSLTKEAMPVIRYRTRDLTALLPPTARDAPAREDHRPLRRHADRAGRQRVPEPDRGDRRRAGPAVRTIPGHAVARRPHGSARAGGRAALRSRGRDDRRRSRGDRARAAAPDQDDDRRIGRRDRARGGRDSDDRDRQGAARDRPPSGGVNPTVTRSTPRKPVRWMD